jgi:hypothetical protein
MNIRTLQEGICALLKSRPLPIEDPQLEALAAAPGLELAREIAHWWRAYQLEQACPLTATWLKQRAAFEDSIAAFYETTNVSPYLETVAVDFAAFVGRGADRVAAALAAFEQALIAVKRGEASGEVAIQWPCDPYAVLNAVLRGEEAPVPGTHYETVVSTGAPGGFVVRRLG